MSGRLVADARVLMGESVGFAAICSNDASSYPEDLVRQNGRIRQTARFPVPLSARRKPGAARAYGAVCTPDFFGLTGTSSSDIAALDEGRTTRPPPGARRELLEAMRAIAADGAAPEPDPVHRLLDQMEGGARVRVWCPAVAPRLSAVLFCGRCQSNSSGRL